MTAQHSIFVSHSHMDNDFGTRLVQDLQDVLGNESAVWYDAHGGLHGGDAWWRKIVQELKSRNIFIVILSPDAMNSDWVNDEIDIAWRQKNSPERMRIFPLLYRPCEVRTDLTNLQIISFLPPKPYETAFQEVLIALGLPTENVVEPKPEKVSSSPDELRTDLLRQIERAFAKQDWPDVIRKVNYLLKRMPDAASSGVYRMQGLALAEEGQVQQAQEALESALALVENRQQRLTVLSDYTALLAKQEQWAKVLQLTEEALRLVPNDPGWLAMEQQARMKIQGATAGTDIMRGPNQPSPSRQWYDRRDIMALALTAGLYLITLLLVLLLGIGGVGVQYAMAFVLGIVSVVFSKRQGFSGLIPAFISGLAGGGVFFILNAIIQASSFRVGLLTLLLFYGVSSLAGAAIYIGIKKLWMRLFKQVRGKR